MKGIAWDDQPNYYQRLADRLRKEPYNVKLDIFPDVGEFLSELEKYHYDFVILDLIRQSEIEGKDDDETAGLRLAKEIRTGNHKIPIFFITEDPSLILEEHVGIGEPICVKDKSEAPTWMAYEIKMALKRWGVWTNSSQIALFTKTKENHCVEEKKIIALFESMELDILKVNVPRRFNPLVKTSFDKLNESSSFILLALPDIDTGNGKFTPCREFDLSLGFVTAMPRGLERTIIVQKMGNTCEQQCDILFDTSYFFTVTYENEIEEITENIKKQLLELNIII